MTEPTPIIAVLGGGQLGRMLALAGYPLGLRFRFLESAADCPAAHVGPVIVGDYENPHALRELAAGACVATYEFENVPVAAARELERLLPVYPPPVALELAQDRLHEKTTFQALAIPTTRFEAVSTRAELEHALRAVGCPAVLKARRFGYDGKGQFLLRTPADADRAWQTLGGQPFILEEFVPFVRELAILGVRGRDGQEVFYDLTQTQHTRGILTSAIAPAPNVTPQLQAQAAEYAKRLLDHTSYVGVLALELFDCGDGRLLANEIAPRVHNSGHWTIDGAVTSQFENHVRAIQGLALGDPAARGAAATLNLIGRAPPIQSLSNFPWAKIHLYGKEPRAGRKVGHVNLVANEAHELEQRMTQLAAVLVNELT